MNCGGLFLGFKFVRIMLNLHACLFMVQVEELMEHLPGPDFPTGGQILGTNA
jgi:DNA gyrase/topoisomerase IV subunit A